MKGAGKALSLYTFGVQDISHRAQKKGPNQVHSGLDLSWTRNTSKYFWPKEPLKSSYLYDYCFWVLIYGPYMLPSKRSPGTYYMGNWTARARPRERRGGIFQLAHGMTRLQAPVHLLLECHLWVRVALDGFMIIWSGTGGHKNLEEAERERASAPPRQLHLLGCM